MSLGTEATEILRPLNDDEVDELLLLYKNKYGIRNFHYLLLYNQRKWDKQLNDDGHQIDESEKYISMRKAFYTHRNADFRVYGTYVSLHYDMMQSVSFHSWQPTLEELRECLIQTKLIAWNSKPGPPLLTNVDLEYCELVKSIAVELKGAKVQRARRCYGWLLSNENAKALQVPKVPAGYTMRPLRDTDAALVHREWPNAKEGSLQYIRHLIRYNKTLGICKTVAETAAEEEEQLVAWIFQNDFSGLGILQVSPSEQRQGLGYLLATAMSKTIASSEPVELNVWTVVENERSNTLLSKIGYEKPIINEWIQLA